MFTSKLFARRLCSGRRRLFGARVSAERALLRDCCKITEPEQESSTAESQLRIDEERSRALEREVIVKF